MNRDESLRSARLVFYENDIERMNGEIDTFLELSKARCVLLNTGWSGGPHGVGSRMSIKHTRALLDAALAGELDDVETEIHPVFNVAMPRSCPGVPADVGEARFARVDERRIDSSLLQFLNEKNEETDSATMQRRFEVLSTYLDKSLICVMIRLPGVCYTFEIDPAQDRIVHWEWRPD